MPPIGAHVSVAGGVSLAFSNAAKIQADCIQIFGSSPRQWQTKFPTPEEIQKFARLQKETGVSPVYLHAAYLVNLGSTDPVLFQKSVRSLTEHLTIAKLLHAEGLIFHPGSGNDSRENSIARIVSGIQAILKEVTGETLLIIENTAGGGNKTGATLEDLQTMLKQADSPWVKICLDTAHALESGAIQSYSRENIKAFFDRFEKLIGIKNLCVIHANDSESPPNSHFDRHENIGEGYIGINGFKNLSQEKRISEIPWILEVPGFDDLGPDAENIIRLKSLFSHIPHLPANH